MYAKAVSTLMLVSSMGMTGFAQDVGNGNNGKQVDFAPSIPVIPDTYPSDVPVLSNSNSIPPIVSINYGEGIYLNNNNAVDVNGKASESYDCTSTVVITVTGSQTLPYCDDSSTNSGESDSSDSNNSSTDSSKSGAASHGMSALYSVAIAAALAAVNVALF